MKRLLLVLLVLGLPGWAKPPVQRPVNNPRPGRATVPTGAPPKILIATGVVSTRSLDRLVLDSSNGTKLTFLLDAKTNIAKTVQAGSKVIVNYDGTLEAGVYRAVLVKGAPSPR